MDRGEQVAVLAGVAADQWGLVTAAQAKTAGLNGVQLKRLAEAALVEIVAHGVYLLVASGQPQHLEIKVAWLRLQPAVPAWQRPVAGPDSGVVSHASACQLHELGDIPAPAVEISVPRRRTTTDPFVHLRIAPVDASDATTVDGLPVTTAPRTIVDLLRAKADGGHIGGVIADAEHRGLVSLDDLSDRVQPFARAYGLPRTADGRALIEHLVAQAGESLHAQQLERAAQQGFTYGSAAVVAALQDATPATTALHRALQDLSRLPMPSVNSAVAAAMRDVSGTSAVHRALQDVARLQLPSVNSAVAAAARGSMPRKVLRGTVVPGPAVLQSVQSASLTQAVQDAHESRTAIGKAPHAGPEDHPQDPEN